MALAHPSTRRRTRLRLPVGPRFGLSAILAALAPTAVLADSPLPEIISVEVSSITTGDSVSIALPQTQIPALTVRGRNFFPSFPGPLVTIRRAGFPDMLRIADNINTGDAEAGAITVRNVDLSAYPPGSFDVVVTRAPSNPGSDALPDAFTLLPHGPDRLESRGAWGGPINQMHAVGNRIYLGAGRRLVVLDATDESNLVELGAIDLKATVLDFEIRDGRAIVATLGRAMNQLCVVDVREPANPRLVWNSRHVAIPCCHPHVIAPLEVEVEGDIAYVLSESSLLHRFDIADPSNPRHLGLVWPYHANYHHFEVENGRLYAMEGYSNQVLHVFDLAGGPTVPPSLVGTITNPIPFVSNSGSDAFTLWQAGGGRVLCTRQDYIYADDNPTPGQPSVYDVSAMVFDVSDPANAVVAGSVGEAIPLFEGRQWAGAAMLPGLLLVAEAEGPQPLPTDGARGLLIYDTTLPGAPFLQSTLKTGGSVYDVRAVRGEGGDRAYLFDRGEGLVVVDISDPDHPVRLGSYHSPAALRSMAREGDLLYVSDEWIGFTVLDVADPSRPRVAGVYRSPTGIDTQSHAGLALGAGPSDGLVYLAAGYGGVDIVDVSDPGRPARVGNIPPWPPGTSVHGVELDGQVLRATAFVPGECNRGGWGLFLRNYGIGDPTAPVWLGESDFISCFDAAKIQSFHGITRVGPNSATPTQAARSRWDSGRLATLDCTDPAAPVLLSVTTNGVPIADFALAGDLFYVCEDIAPAIQDKDRAITIRDAGSPEGTMLGLFNPIASANPGPIGSANPGENVDGYAAIAAHGGSVYAIGQAEFFDGSLATASLQLLAPTADPPGLRLAATTGPETVGDEIATELLATPGWIYATSGDDRLAKRSGRAYAANGLVIVEHVTHRCSADFDGSGEVSVLDIFAFLSAWFTQDLRADADGSGEVAVPDIFAFLSAWFTGCP